MTINRANQTWPEDVMTNVQTQYVGEHGCREYLPNEQRVCMAPETCIVNGRMCCDTHKGIEPMDEFERRQRGSAGTIAALFLVALFAVCAIAVFPMFAALANVAK